MEKNKSIAILGAGLAGLACACRLSELGYKNISIIEKESFAGGLAISIHYKGFSSDLGPHRISASIPQAVDFLNRQMGEDLIICRRRSHMLLDGRMIIYPPRLLNTLSHFGLLKIALFAGSFFSTRLGRLFSPPQEESFETLMQKSFGCALYNKIVKPYTEKTWKMPAAELSPDVAKARVSAGGLAALARRLFLREQKGRETSLQEFYYIKGGIKNLSQRLKEHLEKQGVQFLFNCDVKKMLMNSNGGWKISCNGKNGNEEICADFCFSTIPLPELVDAVSAHEAKQAAAALEYLAMALVFVLVDRPRISEDTWLYFPEPSLIFNRGYESKNFDEMMSHKHRTIICLEVTIRANDDMWNQDDSWFASRVCKDLASTGLVKANEIMDTYVSRLAHAYPIYRRGYETRLDEIFSHLQKFPNLITLGRQGLFHHNNMDHSIYEGILAADYLDSKKEAAAAWYRDAGQFRNLRIVD